MLDSISTAEIILFILSIFFSVIAFFLKDVHSRLSTVEKELQDHRVDDAKNLVSRPELQSLRDDIRGMLSPITTKIESIEAFLRETK